MTAQADAPFRLDARGHRAPAHPQYRRRDGAARLPRHRAHRVRARTASCATTATRRRNCRWARRPGAAAATCWRRWAPRAAGPAARASAFEWTELAYQQRQTSGFGLLMFPLSVLFVFLVLTAQYESWSLPLAIVLIVPLCLLFAVAGADPPRARHQHPRADRLRGAGRPGQQERDPDRRIRRASGGARPGPRSAPPSRPPSSACGRS